MQEKKDQSHLHYLASSLSYHGHPMRLPAYQAIIVSPERNGFIIIEEDYDYDMHYLSGPILPLASADPKGMVVYIGTLSKTVCARDPYRLCSGAGQPDPGIVEVQTTGRYAGGPHHGTGPGGYFDDGRSGGI